MEIQARAVGRSLSLTGLLKRAPICRHPVSAAGSPETGINLVVCGCKVQKLSNQRGIFFVFASFW